MKSLSLASVEAFRVVANHLGITMTDVFSADHVVWVEGATEELCFPFIYKELVGSLPRTHAFVAVMATGDFITKRKTVELTFKIYERLSTAAQALTTSVAFSFDSEQLTESEKAELVKRSRGLVHFLPRRHLEGYLIDEDAIASFINMALGDSEKTDARRVGEALISVANTDKYRVEEGWDKNLLDEVWLSKVDAANLI